MSPSDDASSLAATPPHSQTLSRGIRMLELLSEAEVPLTIAELSAGLGVHRSIAYRILRTLEDHGLIVRNAAGAVQLGARMATLARGVARELQSAALPELTAVASDLGMTAFVAVLDRQEVVTLVSVEPAHAQATLAQRPGTRHPLGVGAPGIAIQSLLMDRPGESVQPGMERTEEIRQTREVGYARSHDEVIPGLSSVAVPLSVPGSVPAALAVVYVARNEDVEEIGKRLITAAAAITSELS